MKFLLTQRMIYLPSLGGANKSNRLLMQELAKNGHECKVVAPAWGSNGVTTEAEFFGYLRLRGIQWQHVGTQACRFQVEGVEVHAVLDFARMATYARELSREFDPTWVLVSSEDPDQCLLETGVRYTPGRVIYVVHTPLQVPFGPESFLPNEERTRLVEQVAGIITVSQHVKNYIKRWSGLDAVVLKFPVYGQTMPSFCGSFDGGFVTMINPCAYKGISIFRELAAQFPEVPFAAVPTWGTTTADIQSLRARSNIDFLNPSEEIDEILKKTRILLIPSLWCEAFGLLSIEAMLRGIPVLASDVGGLPESKLGIDYVFPVNPIRVYSQRFDERQYPVPHVPEQDIGVWKAAMKRLLSDRSHYEELARRSHQAALGFVSEAKVDAFEAYFQSLAGAHLVKRGFMKSETGQTTKPALTPLHNTDSLSVKERSLLQLRALGFSAAEAGQGSQ